MSFDSEDCRPHHDPLRLERYEKAYADGVAAADAVLAAKEEPPPACPSCGRPSFAAYCTSCNRTVPLRETKP